MSRQETAERPPSYTEESIATSLSLALVRLGRPGVCPEQVGRALAAFSATAGRDLHAPTDRLAEVIAAALERDTPEPITTPVASFSKETRDYIARHSGSEGNGFDDIDVTGGGE